MTIGRRAENYSELQLMETGNPETLISMTARDEFYE